jgi:peptidoglycan/LPS O-acetylase OafA/YrhL
LRAIAILAVMTFHLQSMLPTIFRPSALFGWTGVDLFFVLSGFLIGGQIFRAQGSGRPLLWPFYRRRAFRILPTYLVVLALYFTLPAIREFGPLAPLWQYLTFTENLLYDASWNHTFSHVWSLCIEEQFYLLFPLIVLALTHRPSAGKSIWVIAGFVAAGIAVRTWVLVHQLQPLGIDGSGELYMEHIYYPTYSRLDGLLAGVTLALTQTYRPAVWSALTRRPYLALTLGLTFVGIAFWLFYGRFLAVTGPAAWGTILGFPLVSWGYAFILVASVSPQSILARSLPGARTLATLAFTLYLTHKAVAHLDQHFVPQLIAARGLASMLLLAVTCLAVAALLHFCVERPFLRLSQKRLNWPYFPSNPSAQ